MSTVIRNFLQNRSKFDDVINYLIECEKEIVAESIYICNTTDVESAIVMSTSEEHFQVEKSEFLITTIVHISLKRMDLPNLRDLKPMPYNLVQNLTALIYQLLIITARCLEFISNSYVLH